MVLRIMFSNGTTRLSDQMSGFAGSESLRYALFAPILINLWAIQHCFIASRFAAADLQRIEQSAP